jgi:hypothetical protein
VETRPASGVLAGAHPGGQDLGQLRARLRREGEADALRDAPGLQENAEEVLARA